MHIFQPALCILLLMHVLIAQANRFAGAVMEMGYLSIPNVASETRAFYICFGVGAGSTKVG